MHYSSGAALPTTMVGEPELVADPLPDATMERAAGVPYDTPLRDGPTQWPVETVSVRLVRRIRFPLRNSRLSAFTTLRVQSTGHVRVTRHGLDR